MDVPKISKGFKLQPGPFNADQKKLKSDPI